jgi:DNA-3-methyladenine glycosylase
LKLPISYYQSEDVVDLANDLLGKVLFTYSNGLLTAGIITETEAYAGVNDKASHAHGGRRTKRNEIMYEKGGFSYVYLCYGVHYLFNIVTAPAGIPHAILIRGVLPYSGKKEMANRVNKSGIEPRLTNGPGKLSKALGIDIYFNAKMLTGEEIWVEDRGIKIAREDILVSKRIGVDYAGEDANLPYRFNLNIDKYI